MKIIDKNTQSFLKDDELKKKIYIYIYIISLKNY